MKSAIERQQQRFNEFLAQRALRTRARLRISKLKSYAASERGALIEDGRAEMRRHAYHIATVSSGPGLEADCAIVNRSASGFQLEFRRRPTALREFQLTVPSLRFHGVAPR